MNRLKVATVEVFHDVESGPQELDGVLEGLEVVDSIVKGLEILRTDRKIRVSKPDDEAIHIDQIRWPAMPADMNIVLTDRGIYPNTGPDSPFSGQQQGPVSIGGKLFKPTVPGIAIRDRKKRIALVNTSRSDFPAELAAHEVGHLFDLKEGGEKHDRENPGHCIDQACTMFAIEQVSMKRVLREGFSAGRMFDVMKGSGLIGSLKGESSRCFCDECAEQLARNAHVRRLSNL